MKISTKGRYAIRMLLDLAERQGSGPVTLKDIAERQEISKKYLEQIVPLLNKSGILQASRGFQGGYTLARTPDKYTAGEILRLTEGDLTPVPCTVDASACPRSGDCSTLSLWQGLQKVINDYLDSITLQDLLDKKKENYSYDYII